MSPVCSASGMKELGAISPFCGWRQRSSASTERILPVRVEISGW